jgi:hypothetical protein
MSKKIQKNLKTDSNLLVDLGEQPLSNRFLPLNSVVEVPRFPFKLCSDNKTGLVYLEKPFPVTELKSRYDWLTCYEPEDHLDKLVEKIIKLPGVSKSSVFGSYSFKDDTTLFRLKNLGYINNWRIDPFVDLGIEDQCANVETYQSEITLKKARKICLRHGKADVFIIRHVLEHAYDVDEFIKIIRSMINPKGYIIWEIPDCERAFEKGDCTTLWEEHIHYFTQFTFKQLLLQKNFKIIDFIMENYSLENSMIAITQESVTKELLIPDLKAVEIELNRAKNFINILKVRKTMLRLKLEMFKKNRGSIAIFGAGHLSISFLALMELEDFVSFVIDDNENKKGMLLPVGRIKIVGSEFLEKSSIKLCLLGLNPQNHEKVIKKHQKFVEQGGLFASIFPGTKNNLEIFN